MISMPNHWGVAGFPISHSITPRLFSLVGEFIGMAQAKQIYLESSSLDELLESCSKLKGEVWLSCTSPLKHQLPELTGQVGPSGIGSVNQIRRVEGVWYGANTDGVGFVNACKYFGINPEGKILNIRGGGSAARSVAAKWAETGGLIVTSRGRRALSNGPWEEAVTESENADIGVDMDAHTGGAPPLEVAAKKQVNVSYDATTRPSDFSVVMLAAQHLEAWRSLFSPNDSERLPDLADLLSYL